jgi:hypothetical protein
MVSLEKKEFKTIVNQYLRTQGFIKKGSYYYRDSEEMKFVFGLQKSNFSNIYYVNLGIFIKDIHKVKEYPRDIEGDVYLRCYLEENGVEIHSIDLDTLQDANSISKFFKGSIDKYVIPALTFNGFFKLLETHPSLLNLTTLTAKKYLGIEA